MGRYRWTVITCTSVILGCNGQIGSPLPGAPSQTIDNGGIGTGGNGGVGLDNGNDPGGVGAGGVGADGLPTTTKIANTLSVTCTEGDNLMPDIRRLTNLSYLEAVAEFTGTRPARSLILSGLPAQNRDKSITNVDFGLRVDRVFTNRLIELSATIVNEMDWAGFYATHSNGCTTNNSTCQRGFITSTFRKAIGRAPTTEEMANFQAIYTEGQTINLGFQAASRLVTRSILAAPQFIFFAADGSSADAISERARRISLLLYNQPNHPTVLQAGANGELDTRSDVETYVRSALRDRKVSVGLSEFYYDWLNLDRLDYTIDRTGPNYPNYSLATNDALRDDITDYLEHLVFEEGTPFVRSFIDQRAFVRPETAWIYGSMDMPGDGGIVDLSGVTKRSGILTQPGMLTLSLKIEDKSIVDRGVFVNEHILCRDIPLPAAVTPIDQTQFPPDASQREKLVEHEQGPCAGCHVMLDAPGYALETFGPLGDFKAQDRHGNQLRDDGSFRIDGVESAFNSVYEFTKLLAESDELARCIVKKRLSHALAKNVDETEYTCEIDRLQSIFQESNFDMRELTVGIATSHYFMD